MAMEIERKFLFKGPLPDWVGEEIIQGVLKHDDPHIRVRLYGGRGFLTVKGKLQGISRPEWEYEIPIQDAREMLATCTYKIEKTRYVVGEWEVDVFHGENEGLIVAEIELESENQTFDLPEWVGDEVTNDPRYLNSNLSVSPYKLW